MMSQFQLESFLWVLVFGLWGQFCIGLACILHFQGKLRRLQEQYQALKFDLVQEIYGLHASIEMLDDHVTVRARKIESRLEEMADDTKAKG